MTNCAKISEFQNNLQTLGKKWNAKRKSAEQKNANETDFKC